MSKKIELKDMFEEWNDLNNKVQDSFSNFDFSKIKEIRSKQKKIEDSIYEILKENASKDYKETLPPEPGELEVGYNVEDKTFYYVMINPESKDEDPIELIAFTIDISKNVNMIKDFKIED